MVFWKKNRHEKEDRPEPAKVFIGAASIFLLLGAGALFVLRSKGDAKGLSKRGVEYRLPLLKNLSQQQDV